VDAFLKHDKPKQCHFTEVHTHMSYKINYIRNNKNLAIQTWEMHIKLIKQQMDSNFLSLMLWLKTTLGIQQTHQELL
jgi:hypothetical protein